LTEVSNISINGQYTKGPEGERVWTAESATPVDSSGNSLAGESASSQEAYYGALDQVIWGLDRKAPTQINEPPDYKTSIINSDYGEVTPGINVALGKLDQPINPAAIPVGSVLTVIFQDGTTAQFIKFSETLSDMWQWNGIAHNAKGQLIHRDGSLVNNPNTTGTGGGNASAHGIGDTGQGWNYNMQAYPECTSSTIITDGSGQVLGTYTSLEPC
jgi:hypothetical protein